MTIHITYHQVAPEGIISVRRTAVVISLLFLLQMFVSFSGFSQTGPDYEEVYILLNVQGIGGADIPSVIIGEEVWLPVTDIFDFLKIRNVPSPGFESISGFFIDQDADYLIDRLNNKITLRDKVYDLEPGDLILTETNLYLKSGYLLEVFSLNCRFNYRSLSVSLTTNLELPQVREMRLENMRKNISRLKGDMVADTMIRRTYPGFHFGMADWSVYATQEADGICETRFNLALGSVIAGGEANVLLNYSTREPFTEKEQYYLWRFVNNDFKGVRQIMGGKITSYAASSLYAPVVGAQITNTPSTYRRTYGSYALSEYTQPGWGVELYVNNVLVDYVKADASGFFTFQVPVVYGNTGVKLRYYGPWGEERSHEKNILVPFNFIPYKQFEYRISGGMVEDGQNSIYSRGDLNYGLTRWLTIGGGMEYLSSVTSGPAMPFVNFSMRPASSLLLTGEYIHGVRLNGIMSYRFPSDFLIEANYSLYDEDQTAINYNYLEERKLVLSMPIRARNLSLFSRFTVDQIVLPVSDYTTAELLFSGAIYGISANFSTYAFFKEYSDPYVYSRLSLAFRLPARFIITPQAQYEYNQSRFVSAKFEIEKYLFARSYLSLSYEQNFKSDFWNLQLGFRYDLPFAQTALTARNTNDRVVMIESARGSLLVDKKSRYAGGSNRTSVGKGGIVIMPFLDMNCNGAREKGEPAVPGLVFSVAGGRIETDDQDTVIRILDLEPYTSYFVELDRNSFDNIAWQLPVQSYRIAVAANQFTHVPVPVSVVGEVSGTVYLQHEKGRRGLGRILVCFYQSDSVMVSRTLSESGGYFSYLGLAPGSYVARIDTGQMQNLQLRATPESIPFTIKSDLDGDVVYDLEFTLESLKEEIAPQPIIQEEPEKPEEKEEEEVIISRYSIQAGAFRELDNAEIVKERLETELGRPAYIEEAEGLYKVLIPGFDRWNDALDYLEEVISKGFQGAFIHKNE